MEVQASPSVAVALGGRGPLLSSTRVLPSSLEKGPSELFDLTDLYASPGCPPTYSFLRGLLGLTVRSHGFSLSPQGWGAGGSPACESTPGLGSPVCLHALIDGDPDGPAPPPVCDLGSPSPNPGPPGPWWVLWSKGSHPGWSLPPGTPGDVSERHGLEGLLQGLLRGRGLRGCFTPCMPGHSRNKEPCRPRGSSTQAGKPWSSVSPDPFPGLGRVLRL